MRQWMAGWLGALLLGTPCVGQDWVVTFDGLGGTDVTTSVVASPAGDAFQIGHTGSSNTDVVVLKYNRVGTLLWSVQLDGFGEQDLATAAVADDSGNLYVAVRAGHPKTGSDYLTIKLRGSDGAELWRERTDGGHASIDQPNAIAYHPSGRIAVTGLSYNDDADGDYYTVLYDLAGNVLWKARYAGPGPQLFANDSANSVAFDPNGDVFVTGGSPATNGIDDYATLKYDGTDGSQIWLERYEGVGANDTAQFVVSDAAGDCFVTGGSGHSISTLKYSGVDGSALWEVRDDPGGHDRANALLVDPGSGDVLFAGSSDPDFDESNLNDDAILFRRSGTDGALIWKTRLGKKGFNDFESFYDAELSRATVYLAGTKMVSGESFDFWTVAIALVDGSVEWRDTESGPAGEPDSALALAATEFGSVYVGGNMFDWVTGTDFALAHYTVDEVLVSESVRVVGATRRAGSVADLAQSDDRRLSAGRGPGLIPTRPLRLVFTTHTVETAPGSLTVDFELAASPQRPWQEIELYDYVQGRWVSVDVRRASADDASVRVTAPTSPSDFIDPVNGETRARVEFRSSAPFLPLQGRVDLVRWTLTR